MKIETPEFKGIFTPELNKLVELFKQHQHEIRLAGGAVRDILMGRTPSDLDFATTATPEEMKDMFTIENIRMINMKGEKHGTITARINDKENFEITTLRIDVVNHGRHADVEFTKDWEMDAGRRDLTINSMFLGLDGTLYDYFDGYNDLQKKRIAFVGDASRRIQEDYLRILRYFRFCARISLHPEHHENGTLEAIRDNMSGLTRISGERIWMELKKILTTQDAGHLMETMLDLGVAPHIGLPSQVNLNEFRRIWKQAKSNEIQLQAITMLTALIDSEEQVISLRERLKFTTFEKELALFIVEHREEVPDEKPIRPYQMYVIDSPNKAKDTYEWVLELLRYQGKFDLLTEFRKWTPPRFPVGGNVLKEYGVPVGKSMAIVIQELRNEWKKSNFQMDAESLTKLIPSIISKNGITVKR